MRHRSFKLRLALMLFIAGLMATAFWVRVGRAPGPPVLEPAVQPRRNSNGNAPAQTPAGELEAKSRLHSTLVALQNAATPHDVAIILVELRRLLSTLPPDVASATIREFLDSKSDASTRLEMKIGADGLLAEAPSLRVFLLDSLAQFDRVAAGQYAETILTTKSSPDEWAVSLRNYALAHSSPEAQRYLQQKVEEMIRNEPWQSNPSAGFLEAFDVIVYAHDTGFVPDLAAFIRQTEQRDLAHAAYLALDRLILDQPAAVLGQLLQDTDSMKGREATRADYFARADASDPQQKRLLETYLLNPQITSDEIAAFAQIYPNANYMVSYNLLTRTATPDHETLAARDRKALEVLQGWLADPRFAQVRPQLQTIEARLAYFVGQESAAHR